MINWKCFFSAVVGGLVAVLTLYVIEFFTWMPPGADDQYRPRVVVVAR